MKEIVVVVAVVVVAVVPFVCVSRTSNVLAAVVKVVTVVITGRGSQSSFS